MDDSSQSAIYSELLTFLNAFGRPLDRQGGVERGLAPTKAVEFVGKLKQCQASIHGFEVWRQSGDRHTLNHSEIWYPDLAYGDPYQDALATLTRLALDGSDLVFIQF
jgi:hypothetical protein